MTDESSGDERILLLAGDPELSKTVEESLAILGYATRMSSSFEELSEVLSAEQYSLIVIDSSAGTQSDRDLWLTEVRDHHDSVAILMIDAGEIERPTAWPNTDSLRKPFSLNDLAITVRQLLDRSNDV